MVSIQVGGGTLLTPIAGSNNTPNAITKREALAAPFFISGRIQSGGVANRQNGAETKKGNKWEQKEDTKRGTTKESSRLKIGSAVSFYATACEIFSKSFFYIDLHNIR